MIGDNVCSEFRDKRDEEGEKKGRGMGSRRDTEMGSKIDNNKYIMIENEYHNHYQENEKNRESESVTSIKVPTMKPIELDNSVESQHKLVNDSIMSIASNRPGISLADIFNKIAVHDSASSSLSKPKDPADNKDGNISKN